MCKVAPVLRRRHFLHTYVQYYLLHHYSYLYNVDDTIRPVSNIKISPITTLRGTYLLRPLGWGLQWGFLRFYESRTGISPTGEVSPWSPPLVRERYGAFSGCCTYRTYIMYICTLRGTYIGSYVKNIVDNYVYIHTYFDVRYEYMDTFIKIV